MASFSEHLKDVGVDIKNDEAAAEAVSTLTNAMPISAPQLGKVFNEEELKELEALRKEMNDATIDNNEKEEIWKAASTLTSGLAKVIGFIS